MKYTIKQLAETAGVSVRTLHYYDEINLLKPAYIKENGYRYYEDKELLELQQILFFRELEFPLEEITNIMRSNKFNRHGVLYDQKKLLKIKQKRIERLIQIIDKELTKKGGEIMSNQDLFQAFDDEEMKQYQEEAKQRWGHTEAYKQSIKRTKNWTKEDYKRIKEEGLKFTQRLADAMHKNIQSPDVQELIAQHHKGIKTFYDCSYEMYRGLGDLYVTDPRFAAYYDKFKPGLAAWLHQAISYYCDQRQTK